MADLLGSDEFLVNRTGKTYTQEQATLMANLESDDLLLINRDNTTYTITGSDLTESIIDPLEVTVVISPTSAEVNVEHSANPVASGGKAPDGGFVYTYQWIIADDASGTNATDLVGETSSTYTPLEFQLDKFLGCTCVTTDALGTTASGTGYIGPISKPEVPVDIADVVLTQDQTNADRFTSNSFTTTVTYTQEPSPTQTVSMTAKVVGALGIEAGTDVITANDYPGTASTSVPLTLNSDIYLTDGTFEVGDIVQANESYTPETSEILSTDLVKSWNQDEEWSTYLTSSGFRDGYSARQIFNGSAPQSNTALGNNNSAITLTGWPTSFSGELRVWTNGTTNANMITVLSDENNISGVQGNGWYDCGQQTNITSIVVRSNSGSYSPGVGAIELDGKQLVDSGITGDPGWGSTLNLATEKDIKLFQAGDIVQDTRIWDQSQVWSDVITPRQTAVWNAGKMYPDAMQTSGNAEIVTFTGFDYPVTSTVTLTERDTNVFDTTNTKVIVDIDGVETEFINSSTTPTRTDADGVGYWDIPVSPGNVKSIVVQGGNAAARTYLGGVEIDGLKLVDAGIAGETGSVTSVTATDVTAKTITVDGGTWDVTNQSEVWTNGVSSPFSFDASTGFDGDENTYMIGGAAANEYITWTPSTPINYTSSVSVKWGATSSYKVNGGAAESAGPSWSWKEIRTGSGTLTSLAYTRADTAVYGWSAIKVDGKILVDAVNDSRVWSDDTLVAVSYDGYEADKAFDGDMNTWCGSAGDDAIIVNFDPPINVSSSVEVYGGWGSGDDAFARIDSTNTAPTALTAGGAWATLYTGNGSLEAITVRDIANSGGANQCGLNAVRIDGQLLVDAGVDRGFGDTKVSTVSPKQGQGTIFDITDSVVTIDPYTDNCFKEGQHLTHATPKNIQITPLSDSIDSVSGKTLTLTGSKDLVNFSNGDAVTMANADGTAATYNAETSGIIDAEAQARDIFFAEEDLTVSLFGYPANTEVFILQIPKGVRGSDGGTRPGGGAPGGTGGSQGDPILWRHCTVEELRETVGGNSFDSNADFGGEAIGNTPSTGGGQQEDGNKSAVDQDTLDLINSSFYGIEIINGDGGVGGTFGGQSESGYGGGGGGGGLLFTAVDGENVDVPPVVAATDGGQGGGSTLGGVGGYGGTGGHGYGAGGGGGGGGGNGSTIQGAPGPGGTGAPGLTYVQLGRGGTLLSFQDQTDLQYFKYGDVIGTHIKPSDTPNVWSKSGTSHSCFSSSRNEANFYASPTGQYENYWGNCQGPATFHLTLAAPLKVPFSATIRSSANTNDVQFINIQTTDGVKRLDPSGGYFTYTLTLGTEIDGFEITRVDYAMNTYSGGRDRWYGVRNLEIVPLGESSGELIKQYPDVEVPVKVISTDLVRNSMNVDGGTWSNGDTLTKSVSGAGTVSTTDPANNTITLSESNDEWVDGYYVKGSSTNKIEKTGYLKFDNDGNVQEISRFPQAVVTMNVVDPVLTFPAQFATGEVPDAELAYPTSLQTEITAQNTLGNGNVNTSTKASNILYPQFTTRSVPASGEKRTTAEGLAQFIANVDTFSGRQAAANTDPTDATSIYNAKLLEINEELE